MKYILLSLVLLIGALLRILSLDQFPAGVSADEIQQGYTSYSILKTGKDEWGEFLPLNPRGFGDYKPLLYSYFIIPFEAVFGLEILAIRLPSALAGSLTVLIIFFLVKELSKSFWTAFSAALFLSISSWHIIFSRIGWESNLGLMFFSLGILLFLKARHRNSLIVFSALSFGLSILSYHTFKLLTPLFLGGLVIIYWSEIRNFQKKWLVVSSSTLSIFLLIVLFGLFFSGAGRRAADAAIYNPENITPLREIQVEDKLPQPFNRIVNNKIFYIGSNFLQNYFGYFSTTFLISPHRSDSSLFNLSGRWLIPLWQFLLLGLALYLLLTKKIHNLRVLGLWIFLAPIPAALTRDYMATLRVEPFLLTIPILSAFGVVYFIEKFRNENLRKIILLGMGTVIFWSTLTNFDYYLFHHFEEAKGGIKFGYSEAVKFTEDNKANYDKIIFTKKHSQPQIFVGFYSKMDPQFFQKYSKDWVYFENAGFKFSDMIDMNLDVYEFKNVDWSRDRNEKNALLIAAEDEIPPDIETIKLIKSPDGKVVFKIVDTSNQLLK